MKVRCGFAFTHMGTHADMLHAYFALRHMESVRQLSPTAAIGSGPSTEGQKTAMFLRMKAWAAGRCIFSNIMKSDSPLVARVVLGIVAAMAISIPLAITVKEARELALLRSTAQVTDGRVTSRGAC